MNPAHGRDRCATTSWRNTAKSSGLRVEVNAAVVRGSIVPLPGEISPPRGGEKSADAIVVEETSRSAEEHSKVAGGLTSTKGRTEWGHPNRVRDAPADNAGRRGMDESCHDGKHVDAQERTSVRSSRGLAPCLIGTAVYGPVRTVVWDPWLALAVSPGDPIPSFIPV
jgi:hypothetical protein